MQRSLTAVVLACALGLLSSRAAAQTAPAGPPPDKPPAARSPGGKPPTAPAEAPKKPYERLSDEAELARVVSLYEAGKYAECSSEIERLLDPLGKAPLKQASIVENARVYWAACQIGAGRPEAAEAPLRAAIHENPTMKPPDSLIFPQPVVQLFLKVRDSLVNEIRAAEQARIKQAQAEARLREQALERDRSRMRALEKLAQQESVVVKNRRILSFVPFGVGQIQNRQETLGYALMVSEAALLGVSLASVIVQSRLVAQADQTQREGNRVIVEDLNDTIRGWGIARTVTFWTFSAVAVGGILQAQLEYVPEYRETRTRPLPPELVAPPPQKQGANISYAPYFGSNGGGLNVMGRF
jgi:hypothetical protein